MSSTQSRFPGLEFGGPVPLSPARRPRNEDVPYLTREHRDAVNGIALQARGMPPITRFDPVIPHEESMKKKLPPESPVTGAPRVTRIMNSAAARGVNLPKLAARTGPVPEPDQVAEKGIVELVLDLQSQQSFPAEVAFLIGQLAGETSDPAALMSDLRDRALERLEEANAETDPVAIAALLRESALAGLAFHAITELWTEREGDPEWALR